MSTIAAAMPHGLAQPSAALFRASVPATADTLRAMAEGPAPDAASASAVATLEQAKRIDSSKLIDEVKRRSTLVGAVQPVAMFAGLAQHPLQTWSAVRNIGSAVASGNLSEAGTQVGELGVKLTNPDGIAGGVYRGTLFLETAVNTFVGGLEIYHGVKHKDAAIGGMGVADLLSAGSALAFALSGSMVAFGLGIASTMTKVGLVLARSGDYSRIQKVKVFTDAAGSIPSLMLRAGVAPLPATIGNVVIGPAQLLYMNSKWLQNKVDKAIDWIADHLPHPTPSPAESAPPASPTAV